MNSQVVHLWARLAPPGSLPEIMPGLRRASDWSEVVDRVQAEHPDREVLRVAVHPWATLQCLITNGSVSRLPAPVAKSSASRRSLLCLIRRDRPHRFDSGSTRRRLGMKAC